VLEVRQHLTTASRRVNWPSSSRSTQVAPRNLASSSTRSRRPSPSNPSSSD